MRKIFFLLLLAAVAPTLRGATTFAVNNAAIQSGKTNYDWYTNGSTFIRTIYEGASITVNFTGTSVGLNVDVSSLSAFGPAYYPIIAYQVDGGALTYRQLLSSDTLISFASGLPDTTHTMKVYAGQLFGGGAISRWDGSQSVTITGITVDTGKTISAATMPAGGDAIWFGDSITAAAVESGGIGKVPSYAWDVSVYLDANDGRCSIPGQSWNTTGAPDTPSLLAGWQYIYASIPRVFSPAPRFVFCNMGTNNGGDVTRLQVQTWMENVRTAVGSLAYFNMIVQFNQSTNSTAVINGYNDYVAAHPSDARVNLINLGSAGSAIIANPTYTPDGTHPNIAGALLLANLINPLVIGKLEATPFARPGSAAVIFAQVITFPPVAKREDEDDLLAA